METTVLVIDDAPDVHLLLAARLRSEGIRIVSALGWREGLELAVSANPDLILLDVEMPEYSGLELCRTLKGDPRTMSIPIVFLTGSCDVDTKVRGFDLGAIDYVTKPFHPAELRARVRSALRTKRYQDLLTQRAQVDALTGLHNRGYFDTFLASAWASARTMSLVLVDIDHFKRINDEYGHPFGDLVLQRVGEIIGASIERGEAACRYGGEELALVLPDVGAAQAVVRSERLRGELAAMALKPRNEVIAVTASFGVAERTDIEGSTAAALVSAADEALYGAKRGGRNQVVVRERVKLVA